MTSRPPIRPLASERWLGATAPIGRVSRTMALVAGASLLGHLAVVGTVAVAARTAPPPREIAVELVQEVPKPPPEAAAKAEPEAAKSELAKTKLAKTEPAKTEVPKVEAERQPTKDEAKPEPAKPEVTKVARSEPKVEPQSEPPSRPVPKPEPKVAVAPKPTPPPARDVASTESKLAALQRELDGLRAEQAQLQAEHEAARTPEPGADLAPTPAALRDTGLGLLPNSFQAIALPSVTDGPGEAASYEAIVFSELAKAKGIGPRQGVPGTAGVRFTLDAAGKLVSVELIQWSGIPELDTEALALVRRAVFPPPPQGAQRTFVANVNFESRRR